MGLDAARYAHMKAMVHNNMTIGAQQPPKTVNEVYTIAANWIRTQAVHRPGQSTRCHKCKVLGHYANKCPLLATQQEGVMSAACGDDNDASFHANATWVQHVVFTTLIVREISVIAALDPRAKVQPDWVLLDNHADISIVHLRFLRELQSCNEVRVNGVGGLSMTVTKTGHLDDFF